MSKKNTQSKKQRVVNPTNYPFEIRTRLPEADKAEYTELLNSFIEINKEAGISSPRGLQADFDRLINRLGRKAFKLRLEEGLTKPE